MEYGLQDKCQCGELKQYNSCLIGTRSLIALQITSPFSLGLNSFLIFLIHFSFFRSKNALIYFKLI